ncbi:MAG: hypothetical protein AB1721_01230 [Patescibacteria group bacterium]
MAKTENKLKFFSKENLWLVILGYILAVFIARIFIFFTSFVLNKPVRVVIQDTHYHHYLYFGLFPLFVALVFYLLSKEVNALSSFLTGLGIGFVVDEASLLFFADRFDYWSLFNFGAIVFGLGVLNLLFFVLDRQKTKQAELLDFKILEKRLRQAVRLAEKTFFSKLGPINSKGKSLPARNYVLFLTVVFVFMFILFYFAGKELNLI